MNEKPGIQRNRKAIIWVAALILLAGGYYFLKGSKMFVKNHYYYAYYKDVQGLQPSSPVKIKGVRVGKIADIDLTGGDVKITISVRKDVQLPEGTVAQLASGGFTGEKMIDLQPGTSTVILPDYATLNTSLDSSLLPVSVRFTPVFETAKFLMRSTDSTLREVNSLFSTGMLRRTAVGVVNMEEKMRGISQMSASLNQQQNLQAGINNAAAQAQKLEANNESINRNLANAAQSSGKLPKSDMGGKVASLQSSIQKLGNSFRRLDTSMSGLGKLINNKGSYESTTKSFDTLNRNWQQLQKDPPGISIFGGKKKK